MVKVTIDRFEGEFVVLSLSDGQKLNWPKSDLPKGICEGAVLWLSLTGDKEKTKEQKKLAQNILNEILNP